MVIVLLSFVLHPRFCAFFLFPCRPACRSFFTQAFPPVCMSCRGTDSTSVCTYELYKRRAPPNKPATKICSACMKDACICVHLPASPCISPCIVTTGAWPHTPLCLGVPTTNATQPAGHSHDMQKIQKAKRQRGYKGVMSAFLFFFFRVVR